MKFAFLTGGGKGAAEILKRSLRLRRGAGGQVARAGGVLRHECEIARRRATVLRGRPCSLALVPS